MSELRYAVMEKVARWFGAHPRFMIALALLYLISPVDVFPEALVGPVGYIDDFLVLLLPFLLRGYLHKRNQEAKYSDKIYDTSAKEE